MRTILLGLLVVVVGGVGVLMYLAHGDVAGAARADMKADLRNLAYAESLYVDAHHTFTSEISELRLMRFAPSPRVSLTIDLADSAAWHASVTHGRSAQTCEFGGTPEPKAGDAAVRPSCH